MRTNRLVATSLVIGLCVGAVAGVRSLRPDPELLLKQRMAERSLGREKAPLWITEYFDYQCPPCANARGILEQLMADHKDKIFLQVRYFPLPSHKNSMKATVYAECASRQPGKFWKFHDEILKHQQEWAFDSYPQMHFAEYAASAGLNMTKLDACVQDPAIETAITAEKKKAEELGVKITPTLFVSGKMVVGTNALKDEVNAFFSEKKT